MKSYVQGTGFTLFELLVALAIVAILAALAFPSYSEAMQRGRRLDAVAGLLAIRVAQEKWRANHPAYATLDELGWSSDTSPDGYYRLQIERRTAGGFLATATPFADGPQRNDQCGAFAIDQQGPVLSGAYADVGCWRR